MTASDFIIQFDLLYNNLNSDKAPEINDYEKSFLLTLAQEQIVSELYNKSFEVSEMTRRALDVLVTQGNGERIDDGGVLPDIWQHSKWQIADDVWWMIYETAKIEDPLACNDGKWVDVKPELHDEYLRDKENPFRGPSKKRVLRLDTGFDGQVELVSKYKLSEYVYRYVRRPKPILVCDFTQGELAEYDINIRGSVEFNADKPCELSETIQNEILIRAVSLAKVSYNAGLNQQNKQ